jgi:hypothetical protein
MKAAGIRAIHARLRATAVVYVLALLAFAALRLHA